MQNCADKRIGVKRVKTKTGKKNNPYDVTSAATEPPARIRPGAVAGCEQQGAALRQLLWHLIDSPPPPSCRKRLL